MKKTYARFFDWSTNWFVLLTGFLLCLPFLVKLFPETNQKFIESGERNVAQLELALTRDNFVSIIKEWILDANGEEQLGAMDGLRESLATDFFFLIPYGLFLSSLIACLITARRKKEEEEKKKEETAKLIFFSLPWAAIVFDAIENLLLLRSVAGVNQLKDLENIPIQFVAPITVVSLVKWILIVLSLIIILGYLVRSLYECASNFYSALAKQEYVIFLAILFSLFLFLGWHASLSFKPQMSTSLSSQTPYTSRQFAWVVHSWATASGSSIEETVSHYTSFLTLFDFVFPITFALFLASMFDWGTFTPNEDSKQQPIFVIFSLLPFVAAGFDYAENLTLLKMLHGVRDASSLYSIPENLAEQASLFAVIKITLFFFALVLGIIGIVKKIWASKKRREEGSVGVSYVEKKDFYKKIVKEGELNYILKRREAALEEFCLNKEAMERLKTSISSLERKLSEIDDERKYTQKIAKSTNNNREEIRRAKELIVELDKQHTELKSEIEKLEKIEKLRQICQKLEGSPQDKKGLVKERDRQIKSILGADDGKHPTVGLAFSGGGIRSASFNLGITQGLAKYGALPWIDYLTSISGGGMIASALISLLSNKNDKGKYHFNTQWRNFPFNPAIKVFDEGVPKKGGQHDYKNVSLKKGNNNQLKYMINTGNFLAPRLGWITRDMLRGIGGVLAGMGFTLTIFILAITALGAFLYFMAGTISPTIIHNIRTGATVEPTKAAAMEVEPAHVLLTLEVDEPEGKVDLQISAELQTPTPASTPTPTVSSEASTLIPSATPTTSLTIIEANVPTQENERTDYLAFLFGDYELQAESTPRQPQPRFPWKTYGFAILGGVVYGILLFSVLWTTHKSSGEDSDEQNTKKNKKDQRIRPVLWLYRLLLLGDLYVILFAGSQWILLHLATILGTVALIALHYNAHKDISFWENKGLAFEERLDAFLLHALSGLFFGTMVLWIALLRVWNAPEGDLWPVYWIWLPFLFAFGSWLGQGAVRLLPNVGPWGEVEFRTIFWAHSGLNIYGIASLIFLTAMIVPQFFEKQVDNNVIPLGSAIVSGALAILISNIQGKGEASTWLGKITKLLPGIRNIVLGFLVIVFNLSMIFLIQTLIDRYFSSVVAVFGLGLYALFIMFLIGRLINLNYLSLHYFARDRMADAFLKTEVTTDSGQVILVRDEGSSLTLQDINPEGCSAPYHILLGAVNLSGSYHLDYKDRKSEYFTFSKLYSGSDITGYVRSEKYRKGLTKYSRAVAVSGAAASSGLGHFTFLAQAFIMTLFNIRLGLWMVSPRLYKANGKPKDLYELERQAVWPLYLWDEARARISERREMINITDGGHLNNTALYPLFRRRCKLIIAGDASQDPQGQSKELMRVIQLVKADLGIEVEIKVGGLKPDESRDGRSQFHCAVGKIKYPELDSEDEKTGWLVYLKPSVTGEEPDLITRFWERSKKMFPHPDTSDQFFDEEQFEAQRHLGEVTIEQCLSHLRTYYQGKITTQSEKVVELEREIIKLTLDGQNLPLSPSKKNPKVIVDDRIAQLEEKIKKYKTLNESYTKKSAVIERILDRTGSFWEIIADIDEFMADLENATRPKEKE